MDQKRYKIAEKDNCIRVEFQKGLEISPDVIIEAMNHENQLYGIKGRHDWWDFRGCRPSPDFGYDAMSRVVEHITASYSGNWSDKTALLVDDSTQYGLSRMFQTLVDGYPTQIGIFLNEDDARRWISRELNSEGEGQ
jgi:hypothetical protein